jgi:hypothetical protein
MAERTHIISYVAYTCFNLMFMVRPAHAQNYAVSTLPLSTQTLPAQTEADRRVVRRPSVLSNNISAVPQQ